MNILYKNVIAIFEACKKIVATLHFFENFDHQLWPAEDDPNLASGHYSNIHLSHFQEWICDPSLSLCHQWIFPGVPTEPWNFVFQPVILNQ